jgi:hypothetical protein
LCDWFAVLIDGSGVSPIVSNGLAVKMSLLDFGKEMVVTEPQEPDVVGNDVTQKGDSRFLFTAQFT